MYTRCTHCDAVLRLSVAHLREGMGQVRCGDCLSAFNALVNLTGGTPDEGTPRFRMDSSVTRPPKVTDQPTVSKQPQTQDHALSLSIPPFVLFEEAEESVASAPEALEAQSRDGEKDDSQITCAPAHGVALGREKEALTAADVAADQRAPPGASDSADSGVHLPPLELEVERFAAPLRGVLDSNDEAEQATAAPVSPLASIPLVAEPSVLTRSDDDIAVWVGDGASADGDLGLDIPAALRADLASSDAESAPRRYGRTLAAMIAIGVLVLALPVQYAWFVPTDLQSRYPQMRDMVNRFCGVASCRNWSPPYRREQIRMISREVTAHPKYHGALQVRGLIVNDDSHPQSYPIIRFSLFNVNGQVIASRMFNPNEYLTGLFSPTDQMAVGATANIEFDVLAPEDTAVSFEFEFI